MADVQISKQKLCFKCGVSKPITEFYKHSGMADGRVNKCKECNKKDVRENYRANIDHYKQYEQTRLKAPHRVAAREQYSKTKQGIIAGNNAKKRYTERNPEKKAASTTLCNAVRCGKIIKMPCEVCGSENRVHGHHDDYNQPLNVRWLCPQCHRDHHKKICKKIKYNHILATSKEKEFVE